MPLIIMPEVEHSSADFHLDDVRVAALWDSENRHFWHSARNSWILLALDQYLQHRSCSILDVGCGSGAVARSLLGAGYDVTGIDTAEVLVRRAHVRLPQAWFICGDLTQIPAELVGPYDVIAFFDVLEHLDSPRLLLQSALRFSKSGSLIIATVPAKMSLFSEVDIASGHKRRYERNELAELFRLVGLTEIREHGIFRVLSILLKLRRKAGYSGQDSGLASDMTWANSTLLRDIRVPSVFMNTCARFACAIERRFYSRSEGALGASILAVGVVP